MTKRGRILRDTNVGPGMLTVDGTQYSFTLEGMWRSDIPPRTGMMVEVNFNSAGAPEAVYAVSEGQIAKEQAQKALASALHHGETMKGGILKRFGIGNAVAMILLLVSFFFLPNLRVGSAFGGLALSGWEGTGLNPATMMTNDWGILSLLAIACLFIPFGIPFLRPAWARWLYAAPITFAVIYFVTIYHEVNSQAQAGIAAVGAAFGSNAVKMAGAQNSEMVTFAIGAYLVILCSLFLAWQAAAFRKISGNAAALAALSMGLLHGQLIRAQSAESPDYSAAKATAFANWIAPPIMVNGVKDPVGVLTRDANELNAVHALYKGAPPAVQGAVDGSMIEASQSFKVYAGAISSAHNCELTPLAATVDPLTRAASQVTDVSLCLGGQPAETLGHKIANQGNVRALERQFTLGHFGRGDKSFAIAKGTDPKFAGDIDFAVQEVANNFSKNDLAAEIARERQAPSPQSQPSVPAAPSNPPPSAPPAPQRPASTVVDLPPAAPGYPPMHVSRTADDGCWWSPFLSQSQRLEMAVLRCEKKDLSVVAGDTRVGIKLGFPGSTSPSEQVLTVESKPADQTMEAAIKQQFISKLKVPAARLSCRAQCETESDGMVSCKVTATGAYSKLKRFNSDEDDSEDPCPGLMTNDAVEVFFLARPSESKTRFFLYTADDMGAALVKASIHFRIQP